MNSFIDSFINDKRQFRNISLKTVLAYRSDLMQFAEFQHDHHLTLNDGIIAFVNALQFERHLAAKTISRKITTCKMFYRYLLDVDVIDKDPNTGFRRNTKFIVPKTLPHVLQVNEVSLLLQSAYNDQANAKTPYRLKTTTRNVAVLELLAATGLRIGELSSLRVADLKLNERSLLVHGKNRKERMLFLSSPDTYQAMKQYLSVRSEFTPHCFVNKYVNQLSIFRIENIFLKFTDLTTVSTEIHPSLYDIHLCNAEVTSSYVPKSIISRFICKS